jgi:prepilin-type N-terminal cleavage/methylation domain-containing protein
MGATPMTGKSRHGFSLFEMLFTVAIIGIVVGATMPVAEVMFIKGKETELEDNLYRVRQAISLWKRDCYNAVVKQHGYIDTHKIPDAALYPPSLLAMVTPESSLAGGKFSVHDADNNKIADFYPRAYLNEIPVDPFVGAAAWVLHYASGTSTTVFTGGTVAPPENHVGIFDISCVDNTDDRRRGFVQAIDGTNYVDW